jgi:glutathione S-transferase
MSQHGYLPYTAVPVDIRAGENREARYLKINPSGAVPALCAGDAVITESQAILTYIVDLAPEAALIPRPGTVARAKAHEWMNWLSSNVHVAYRSIFRPQIYAGDEPQAISAVRDTAKRKLLQMLLEVETRLGESGYAVGSDFSVVDAYLFVFYRWSFDERLRMDLLPRARFGRLAAQVWSRPAVGRVIAREQAVRVYALPPGFV